MIAKLIAAITMLMVGLAFLGIAALCIVLFLASRRPSPAAEAERVSRIEDIHGISAAALHRRSQYECEAERVAARRWKDTKKSV